MSDYLEAIGQRAAACSKWKWLAGMQAVIPAANDGATGYLYRVTEGTGPINNKLAYPNFADPATLGALAYLVREAAKMPWLFSQFTLQESWSICDLHQHSSNFVRTEAEAWVEVLEELDG